MANETKNPKDDKNNNEVQYNVGPINANNIYYMITSRSMIMINDQV